MQKHIPKNKSYPFCVQKLKKCSSLILSHFLSYTLFCNCKSTHPSGCTNFYICRTPTHKTKNPPKTVSSVFQHLPTLMLASVKSNSQVLYIYLMAFILPLPLLTHPFRIETTPTYLSSYKFRFAVFFGGRLPPWAVEFSGRGVCLWGL